MMLSVLWKTIFLFSSATAILPLEPATSTLFNGTADICISSTDQCLVMRLCRLTAILGTQNLIDLIPQDICLEGTAIASLSLTNALGLTLTNFMPSFPDGGGCTCYQCQGTCVVNPLAGCTNTTNSTDTSGQTPVVDTPISGRVGECSLISPSRSCIDTFLCNLQTQPGVIDMANFPRVCSKGTANLVITYDPLNLFDLQLSNVYAPIVPQGDNCTCSCLTPCRTNGPIQCPSNATTTPCPSRYTSTTTSCPSTPKPSTVGCSPTTTSSPSTTKPSTVGCSPTTTSSPSTPKPSTVGYSPTTTSSPSTPKPSTVGCSPTTTSSPSTPKSSCSESTSTTQKGSLTDTMNSMADMIAG